MAISTPVRANARILIAAASDLQLVLPQIVARFTAETSILVQVSYGSTGNFARQIRQGAPFEVFLAADERFIQDLARDGIIPDAGQPYARGRLALVAFRRGPFAAVLTLEAVAAAAMAGQAFRLAIANPEHAPYGQRAVEVITQTKAGAALTARIVYGENVTQAHQMVATGAVQAGITAMSLATAAPDAVITLPIDEALHTPLVQRLAVTRKAGEAARRFADFMTSRVARELLLTNGFAAP